MIFNSFSVLFVKRIMEDFVLRSPLIGQKIFNKLDNQNLTKVERLTKFMNRHLEKDKSFWQRILQKYEWKHLKTH